MRPLPVNQLQQAPTQYINKLFESIQNELGNVLGSAIVFTFALDAIFLVSGYSDALKDKKDLKCQKDSGAFADMTSAYKNAYKIKLKQPTTF